MFFTMFSSCHVRFPRSITLRITINFRMRAKTVTFGFLPTARSRSANALMTGLKPMAAWVASRGHCEPWFALPGWSVGPGTVRCRFYGATPPQVYNFRRNTCVIRSGLVRGKTIPGKRRTLTVDQIMTNDSQGSNRLFGLPSLSARFGLLLSTIAIYAMAGINVLMSKWLPSFAFLTAPIFAYLMSDWLVGLNCRFNKGGPSPRAHRLIQLLFVIILAFWVIGLVGAAILGTATGKWSVIFH